MTLTELTSLREDLRQATQPNRALDARLARLLPNDAMIKGRSLGSHVGRMAFTSYFESAERFLLIALPGWGWTLSGAFKSSEFYNCCVYAHDGSEYDGEAATPAFALLIAAINALIDECQATVREADASPEPAGRAALQSTGGGEDA